MLKPSLMIIDNEDGDFNPTKLKISTEGYYKLSKKLNKRCKKKSIKFCANCDIICSSPFDTAHEGS